MFVIISSSPNNDGLTAACVEAATRGFREEGADVRHISLCDQRLEHCRQCNNGWGQCREEHTCVIDDDLGVLQQAISEAEGIIWVTPVYFGDISESARSAFDRLRRCNFWQNEVGLLREKAVICVAAAGGSGGGISSCLVAMERYVQHMRGQIADLIGITRRNRIYTLESICGAATALAISTQSTANR